MTKVNEVYKDTFLRKPYGPVLRFDANDGKMPRLVFPKLEEAGKACGAVHLTATRLGGVSEGIFESMNFLTRHGDPWENILANYAIVGEAMGVPAEMFAHSMQKHTTNLRVITKEDAGKFLFKPIDYDYVDALDFLLVCANSIACRSITVCGGYCGLWVAS